MDRSTERIFDSARNNLDAIFDVVEELTKELSDLDIKYNALEEKYNALEEEFEDYKLNLGEV